MSQVENWNKHPRPKAPPGLRNEMTAGGVHGIRRIPVRENHGFSSVFWWRRKKVMVIQKRYTRTESLLRHPRSAARPRYNEFKEFVYTEFEEFWYRKSRIFVYPELCS